jgi:glutathione S-transferase
MSATTMPTPAATEGLKLFELAAADPEVRFSPHCWKTRMALAHKGLDANRVPWRFSDKQELAFSGQGFVPVMVDQGEVVSDSWQIALHLEQRYPERPSLFGSADAVPLARFVNAWADGVMLGAIAKVILVDIHRHIDVRDKEYFRTSREKRFGAPLEAVAADTASRLAELRAALAPLRSVLGHQEFVCGASPGYADYCVFGMFMWARCISGIELLAPDDKLVPWRERLLDAFGGMARQAAIAAKS